MISSLNIKEKKSSGSQNDIQHQKIRSNYNISEYIKYQIIAIQANYSKNMYI